jgi:hypothetical protein
MVIRMKRRLLIALSYAAPVAIVVALLALTA